MQQCNDLKIFNQASRIVLSILLKEAALEIEAIENQRIDKVSRWREGIENEGLTVVASARLVGEPVANLYRWKRIIESTKEVQNQAGKASGLLIW